MLEFNTPISLWCFCYKYNAGIISLCATSRVRLRICWYDSKILQELLEKYLLEVLIIIRLKCQWEANQFK